MSTSNREVSADRPLAGLRIGVMGKGGVGKSTVTVLLARELATKGYEVCILDADSSNVGLHTALGLPEPPTPLIQYFGGMVFSGGSVTCPVDDPTPLPGSEVSLGALPHHYWKKANGGIWLLTAGKLGDFGPGAGCDGPIAKIARDLLVDGPHGPVLTLVDLKAGMEDSARGVLPALDWALVVVDPSQAAVRMAADLNLMVAGILKGEGPATEHLESPDLAELAMEVYRKARIKGVLAVLNRVPDAITEAYLAQRLSEEAEVESLGTLAEDSGIANSWLRGFSLVEPKGRGTIAQVASNLERAAESHPVTMEAGSHS